MSPTMAMILLENTSALAQSKLMLMISIFLIVLMIFDTLQRSCLSKC